MLIIRLQGVWLPLTVGFLVSGPISGTPSDRFGRRRMQRRRCIAFA
ncbi:hypothetical protein [Herbiconiux sp. YIM B11900]